MFERVSLLLLNSLILYSNPKTYIISSQCAINELCAIVEMAHAKIRNAKITHYERLLDMIKPSVIHVLWNGKIVKTAGPELAKEIETRGYDWIKQEVTNG